MIRFSLGIPVAIRPMFWVTAALIGFLYSMNFIGTLVWVGVILVSVIIHELGHALVAKSFGKSPQIELVAFGGLTYHDASDLALWKQFLIVLSGPLFGFGLFLLATILQMQVSPNATVLYSSLAILRLVNLFWTIVNLVPVLPLDGGQLLRIICEGMFGFRGIRYSQFASFVVAGGLAFAFFFFQWYIAGILFFLLAFQSFDVWRKSKGFTATDQSSNLKGKLENAEALLLQGKKGDAVPLLEELRGEAKEGMIYYSATQLLSFLRYEEGDTKGAYELLHPIKDHLGPEATCILHQAAFVERDFPTVAQLSAECFQVWQTAETALRSAYAFAMLSEVKSSIGWLKAAIQGGLENLEEVVKEKSFDSIRNDPIFRAFIDSHHH